MDFEELIHSYCNIMSDMYKEVGGVGEGEQLEVSYAFYYDTDNSAVSEVSDRS